MKLANAVAITGIGLLTSLGEGRAENWRRLVAGQSGVRKITRFATDGMKTQIAGTVDFLGLQEPMMAELSIEAGGRALQGALEQSAIGRSGDLPGPLFVAGPPIEHEWSHRLQLARAAGKADYRAMLQAARQGSGALHRLALNGAIAEALADRFGTKGAPITVNTACASGATAIQLGVEAIRRGESDAAFVVGADLSVQPESIIRFMLLSALSTANDQPSAASKPFAKGRDGFVMAEGAAALVLESPAAAKARGARILGYVLGCGEAADGFHRTRSSPDGAPILRCMRNALADAGLTPERIDYVNPHGTSTPENDKMEALGLHLLFGQRANRVPVSSNKSMIGHTLTAAGVIEAAISLLTIAHQTLPPNINCDEVDEALGLDVVREGARPAKVETVLSNSFGFGGQNVSLVLSARPD